MTGYTDLDKRKFEVSKPSRIWVSDITYIRTREGWLYLAIVKDLFSRKIVGWATRLEMHRDLVLDAVMMAVKERNPKEAIGHSDQGSQYGSRLLSAILSQQQLEAQHEPARKLLG